MHRRFALSDEFVARGIVVALVASLAVAGLSAPAVAHGSDAPTEGVRVVVAADGSATVAVTYAYDLSDDGARAAFENLSSDTDATAALADRFERRLASVADAAENATGRSMTVGDASIDLHRTEGTGYVTLSVPWDGLAAVSDGRLVLGEPFASGFETDRPVTVAAPSGYVVQSATPTPDERGEGTATWAANRSLDGFEVVLAPADTTSTAGGGSSDGFGPGFGPVTALGAIAGALAVLGRRRRGD